MRINNEKLNRMEEIKILEILTKKAEKYNVSFCGVESNAIIETVNEALSLHNVVGQSEQLPDVYLQELSKVEWTQQTQVSLNEQLQILRQFANKLGLYDASDYLKK